MRMLIWLKQRLRAWGGVGLLGMAMAIMSGLPAQAGLEFCNQTAEKQWVALGYDSDEGWISEGWWGAEIDACVTIISEDLNDRYFYYHLFDASFVGEGFAFCIKDEVYKTEIDDHCEAHGFETADFSEIDAGPNALSYTVTIAAPNSYHKKPPQKSGGFKKY